MPATTSPLRDTMLALARRPTTSPNLLTRLLPFAPDYPALRVALIGHPHIDVLTAIDLALPDGGWDDRSQAAETGAALLSRPDLTGDALATAVSLAGQGSGFSGALHRLLFEPSTPTHVLRRVEPLARTEVSRDAYSTLLTHRHTDTALVLTALTELVRRTGREESPVAGSGGGSQGLLGAMDASAAAAAFDAFDHPVLLVELATAQPHLRTRPRLDRLAEVAVLDTTLWGRTAFGKTHPLTAAVALLAEHADGTLRARCATAMAAADYRIVGATPHAALGIAEPGPARVVGHRRFRAVADTLSRDDGATDALAAHLGDFSDAQWAVFTHVADTFAGTVDDLLTVCRGASAPPLP